ncbi:hypothetical protein MJ584_01525 [Klebsiella pneumoniae]|nr:hypothetical protein MJ584_01525 [Klebsiella pneumoniae]
MRFFERQKSKTRSLTCALSPSRNDDAAFERVVNTPTRGIGDRTLDVVRQTSARSPADAVAGQSRAIEEKALAGRAASALQRMELIDALAQGNRYAAAFQTDRVIKDSGLRAMYEREKGEGPDPY